MADRSNRLVRLMADGSPVATGLVLLGDSAMCTNPCYGRGVGLALVHARAFAQVLEDAGDDPEAVTPAFEECTHVELEPWHRQAVAGDRVRLVIGRRVLAGEPLETIGGAGDDPAVRLARAAPLAVERDAIVRRASHRAFQLLDPPSTYQLYGDTGDDRLFGHSADGSVDRLDGGAGTDYCQRPAPDGDVLVRCNP